MTDTSDRVAVPDPDSVRRGARRAVGAGIVIVLVLAGFAANGVAMLVRGEPYGLPFAVGGAVGVLADIAITAAGLRVRSSLRGDTVSRAALLTARRVITTTRVTLIVTVAALGLYALVLLTTGDPWPLLTAVVIGIPLVFLVRGTTRIRAGLDTMLTGGPPSADPRRLP